MATVTKGLWVPLEAKPGKEEDVARFLEGGSALAEEEPDTIAWFAGQARQLAVRDLRRLPRRLGSPGAPLRPRGRGADGPGGRAARTASGHPAGRRSRVKAAGLVP